MKNEALIIASMYAKITVGLLQSKTADIYLYLFKLCIMYIFIYKSSCLSCSKLACSVDTNTEDIFVRIYKSPMHRALKI